LSNMDYNIFEPQRGQALDDPTALFSAILPLLSQTGGNPLGVRDLNFLLQLISGDNIADVFGMGKRADLVPQPERRENVSASWLRNSEIGESILNDLLQKRESPQEILQRLKSAAETSPDVRAWVENTTNVDKTTGQIDWDNMRSLMTNVIREETEIDQEFRNRERDFIAQQASQPRYGYEQPDPEIGVQEGMRRVDPEAAQRKLMADYAKNFPGAKSAASTSSAASAVPDLPTASVEQGPISRGRGGRDARARREREESRPPREDRSGRSRSQIRRGGGSGRRSPAMDAALNIVPLQSPVNDSQQQEEIRRRALEGNRRLAESSLRAFETYKSQNSPARPTADTQRILSALPFLLALGGGSLK
jgi:hypothetical protein